MCLCDSFNFFGAVCSLRCHQQYFVIVEINLRLELYLQVEVILEITDFFFFASVWFPSLVGTLMKHFHYAQLDTN